MSETLSFIEGNFSNLLAVSWFLLCFVGYTEYARRVARSTHSLSSVMHRYRVEWMERMLVRDVRIADTTVISTLERGVAFFASTTLLILAGLITVLGSTEKAIDIISDIPFASQATTAEWEMKLLLLVAVFIYAFFKFTWGLRQYGFTSVMLGSTPMPSEQMVDSARQAHAIRIANMMSLAANNFNSGLRSYYFSMAVLGWFINPWFFIVLSTGIVWVLYRREFKSRTLAELVISRSE